MHEEQPRFLIQHMAVKRSNQNPVVPECPDNRINLACNQHKIACYRSLSSSSRLEVYRGSSAHRYGHFHSMVGDLLTARYAKLINAAVVLSTVPHNLVYLGSIEIQRRRSSRSRRWIERSPAERKSGADRAGQLHGIAVSGYMHVNDVRRLVEQMIVHGRLFNPLLLQLHHNRSDLVFS